MGHLCQLFTHVSVSLGTLTVVKGEIISLLVLGRKGVVMLTILKNLVVFVILVTIVIIGVLLAPMAKKLATSTVEATKKKLAEKKEEAKGDKMLVPQKSRIWRYLALALFLLLALEMIGALVKPFALMIRLFANMIAGHIVLASILLLIFAAGNWLVGITSALGCVALSALELFVAFLRTYIFVFLTTLFIGAAVEPEH